MKHKLFKVRGLAIYSMHYSFKFFNYINSAIKYNVFNYIS